MMARRGGLGTHLDALIPTSLTVGGEEVATQNEVALSEISPNPRQPRTHFDQEAMNELIASIKEIGILQPPVVRQTAPNKYELVMGERRFRAAKAAGLKTIPVIIRQTADNELLREALIENIHRSQLNALEEAAAYSQLLTDFNCTHEELAVKLGRSRPLISNTIRLMNLPLSVQQKVASGALSAGHARALLGLSDSQAIEALANKIVKEGLSVRATEQVIATNPTKKKTKKLTTVTSSDVEFNEIAERIGDALDTRVTIQGSVKKGTIVIEFAGAEDLKRLTQKLEG
ncbi:MAG: ParB/RepB/Spo0J family partition protein [Actinobacteria bacterium]|nr:ParB/RepB/Spo0J family partition protein [Actinomycetota bacterium]MSY48895.1 ParB/RepB/Spo0J family partition protein [Actinomycetota bacterium]